MPSTLKLGGQPGIHNFHSQVLTDDTGAQGQHIGIVVAAGQGSRQRIRAQRTYLATQKAFLKIVAEIEQDEADTDELLDFAAGA